MNAGNYIEVAIFTIGVFLGVYAFVYRLDRRVTVLEGIIADHEKVITTVASLTTKLDKVMNDNEIFWRVIGPHLENIIHSPKSVDRDALVAKLTAGTIECDELEALIPLLQKAIENKEWSNEKRFAGVLLLARATALFHDERCKERRTA